jgi:glycosyltransferase involved in cell wall biosynthesis
MIAVGATTAALPVRSGFHRYSLELLRELLRAETQLFGIASSPAVVEHFGARVRATRSVSLAEVSFRANVARLLWHQTALPALLRRERASVFHSTIPEGMLAPACPQVITVHDLLPLRFPESSPRLRHYYRHVLPRLIRASEAVIVSSEATRADVRELCDASGTPVHVVYPGYDERTFRRPSTERVDVVKRRFGLDEYVLAVGEVRPYKNIPRLVQAISQVRPRGLTLAIAGASTPTDAALSASNGSPGEPRTVRFLGRPDDDTLAALYAGAEALVFPSLYEGFGIPPLEAMACGCPVVASRAGPMPEVCGNAAEYVEPTDVESIAAGIERVVNDAQLRDAMRSRGLSRVGEFSYGRAAREVLGVLRRETIH